MKKYAITLLSLAMFCISCGSQKPKAQQWIDLLSNNFDQGWHTYGKEKVGTAWSVEKGVLHLNPDKAKVERGDLVTNNNYENFHLKYDWKISKNGNSGVMFNVYDDAVKYPQTYLTGPEMQVLDNNGHPDAKIFKHRAGDLYDLIPCSVETAKKYDEWNHAEIILNKGELQFFLNDKQVVKTMLWDANWDKMLAASKFKDMPDFGKYRSGKIALQDHGDQVWFKNILIKKL